VGWVVILGGAGLGLFWRYVVVQGQPARAETAARGHKPWKWVALGAITVVLAGAWYHQTHPAHMTCDGNAFSSERLCMQRP